MRSSLPCFCPFFFYCAVSELFHNVTRNMQISLGIASFILDHWQTSSTWYHTHEPTDADVSVLPTNTGIVVRCTSSHTPANIGKRTKWTKSKGFESRFLSLLFFVAVFVRTSVSKNVLCVNIREIARAFVLHFLPFGFFSLLLENKKRLKAVQGVPWDTGL